MSRSLRQRYEQLLETGRQQFRRGDFKRAFQSFDKAVTVAARLGEDELVHRATVIRLSISLEISQLESAPELARSVLLHSKDPISRFVAATALTRFYQQTKSPSKALFYARVALAIAPESRRGSAAHLLGITLLASSDFDSSLTYLRQGLEDWPHDLAPVTLSLSALAYVSALSGRPADSTFYAREAEALLPVSHSPVYSPSVHLNLGFAALASRQVERAYFHGTEALAGVETLGTVPSHEHKSALYLVGECAVDLGDLTEAESAFETLAAEYYPKLTPVSDLLLALRTSSWVNWLI